MAHYGTIGYQYAQLNGAGTLNITAREIVAIFITQAFTTVAITELVGGAAIMNIGANLATVATPFAPKTTGISITTTGATGNLTVAYIP